MYFAMHFLTHLLSALTLLHLYIVKFCDLTMGENKVKSKVLDFTSSQTRLN